MAAWRIVASIGMALAVAGSGTARTYPLVEGSKAGQVAEQGGVKLVGYSNLPGRIAADASALYARNLVAFAGLLLNNEGQLEPDFEDEILKASLVTKDGAVTHPQLKG